jgi:hypothetical protein
LSFNSLVNWQSATLHLPLHTVSKPPQH